MLAIWPLRIEGSFESYTLLLDQLDLKLKQHMQETLMDPLDRTLFVLFGASGSFLHTF